MPQYIRLIAERRFAEAYLVNWHSNRFPGVLGRICDRPCEPACRRGRLDSEPVAICRLKRVAFDNKGEIKKLLPKAPKKLAGPKIALIGAGPASLSAASDLALMGYRCEIFEREHSAGGAIFTQVPKFRLPATVLEEELGYIWDLGVKCNFGHRVENLDELLNTDFAAILIGTGACMPKELELGGQEQFTTQETVRLGIEFLAAVSFGHINTVARNVLVIGGGNTAMDCARTALRLGADQVDIVTPEPADEMRASSWERDDALAEQVRIKNLLLPLRFATGSEQACAVEFAPLVRCYDKQKRWAPLRSTDQATRTLEAGLVIIAIGQETAFDFVKDHHGIKRDKGGIQVDPHTLETSRAGVFVAGDAAFGPKNMIEAVAHGHLAAHSIDQYCRKGKALPPLPPAGQLEEQRMGLNQWAYDNEYNEAIRQRVPQHALEDSLKDITLELERGFDAEQFLVEASRCLNCDVETVLDAKACIECDACVDVCPTLCLSITPSYNDMATLRANLKRPAQNLEQQVMTAGLPQTGRLMVKDEDLCLHCGLCAERCPTSAWSMQALTLDNDTKPCYGRRG